MLGVGLDLCDIAVRQRAASSGYDLADFYSNMDVQPDETGAGLYQALADGLYADGEFARLKSLILCAAHDEQACRVDMVNQSNVWSTSGGVNWVADTHLMGNGVNGYLDSNIADNAASPWSQDIAALSVWCTVEPTNASGLTGSMLGVNGTGATRISGTNAGAATGRIHSSTANTATGRLDCFGLITIVRVDATTTLLYRDGVLDHTQTTAASAAPVAGHFQLFKNNAAFGDAGISMASIGAARNATQELAFYNRTLAYMQGKGVL